MEILKKKKQKPRIVELHITLNNITTNLKKKEMKQNKTKQNRDKKINGLNHWISKDHTIVHSYFFLCRWDCPEGDYAEPLRKQQSAKWSMDT